MTELEERLRRDLQWVSQRAGAESIRPLRVPPARRRARAVRWLAPVAAVAAVIGVVTGVSLASGSQGHRSAPVQSPVPPESAGPMPRYYVTAWQTFAGSDNGRHIPTFAVVHDSATGAVLATVRVPTVSSHGGTQGPSITAGSDLTYVIGQGGRYYLMRVAPDGHSATLSRLSLSIPGYNDVALSPDGRMLATVVQSCHAGGCQYTGIQVVTLATGASRTWTTQERGAPFSLSWAGNGHVAFQWHQGYRLLDITQPGTNLLASSVPIAGPPPEAADYGFVPPALVTPDGRAVVTSTVQNIPEGNGRDTVVAKIVELDAGTGQLLKVLYTATARHVTTQQDVTQTNVSDLDQGCQVLSLGPTGVQPLVNCFAFGRVEKGRLTPLPGFPSPSSSGISPQDTGAW
jgi:hypothetical protein